MGGINSVDGLKNKIFTLSEYRGNILRQTQKNVLYIDNNKYRIYFTYLKIENSEIGRKYSFKMQVKKNVKSDKRSVWTTVGEKVICGFVTDFDTDFLSLLDKLESMGYLGFTVDNVDPKIEKALEKIAQDNLDIETLKTRKSDELDFHEVAVWGIKAALIEAFELGLGYNKN